MSRNSTVWEKDDDGGAILPQTVTDVTCPNECYGRGQCNMGRYEKCIS